MQTDTADLDRFRKELADFLDNAVTEQIQECGRKMTSFFPDFEGCMAFHRLLHTKGWSAYTWSKENGGPGWSAEQQRIFDEECRKRDLPFLLPHGIGMVGPAIIHYGTAEQKQRYLPGIISGEDFWCQGYSEPNSGSDLVSLQCRAERKNDHYLVNGSKIWTTYAHHANRMFLLVRTSTGAKPQAGITFLLLDRMDYPGMKVREIVGLDGLPEQCEVFFDNVQVPLDGCLGVENDGWSVAKYLLEHERSGMYSFAALCFRELDSIKAMAAKTGDGMGGRLVDDPAFQQEFASLYLEAGSLGASEMQYSKIAKGSPESGPMSSMIKIQWSETLQRINSFALEVTGILALPLQQLALQVGTGVKPLDDRDDALTVMPTYLNNRASSIYGGSNEIQRDIIAKSLLAR